MNEMDVLGWKGNLVPIVILVSLTKAFSQPSSVCIEDLTWREVREKIRAGTTTAIVFAGSTEQNGSHLALGKHNFISHYVAVQIARRLGNALVYPILPFAPAGDPVSRTGHMRYPGTVSLSNEVFSGMVHDVALSAIAAGFSFVMVMGDHGGGQEVLRGTAASVDSQYITKGTRVFYVPDVYFMSKEEMKAYLSDHGLPPDAHAGIDDTSELMFIDRDSAWVRRASLASPDDGENIPNGTLQATAALGEIFIGMKITNAVRQIRRLCEEHR
jgi:creatinine amidohydrolase/Fe(II)-dependent formamide hydrolase-like protein